MDKSSAAPNQLDIVQTIKLLSVYTLHGVIVLISPFFFLVRRIPLQNFSNAVCFFSFTKIEFFNWNEGLLLFLERKGRVRSLLLIACWIRSTGRDFDFLGLNDECLLNREIIVERDLNFNLSEGISILF